MTCGIYSILNKINNKCYIGKSTQIETRWTSHKYYLNKNKHNNKHLQNSWNKYGENNFEFYILIECSNDVLNKFESLFIALYDTTNSLYGYNLASGGEGNTGSNEELRRKKVIV